MDNLKPCPFCGSGARLTLDPRAVKDTQGNVWAYQVVCNYCCATTGVNCRAEKAIEAWNTRKGEGE